ncbi:MAG: hypothetical protein U1C48_05555 [Methylotenera sp.]|nr:hypothetical protein [Methylotenera sp.]
MPIIQLLSISLHCIEATLAKAKKRKKPRHNLAAWWVLGFSSKIIDINADSIPLK